MKKTLLTILLCGVMVLGITGCSKEKETDNLKDTYNKVAEYFGDVNADRSNLSAYSLDEENNVVIVELIDNGKDNQENFIKQTKVNSKYIKFEQGGPNYTSSEIDFYISKPDVHNDIRFNDYYSMNDRTIYLSGNVDEFYIMDNGVKETLKKYVSSTFQTLDDAIKSITDKMQPKEILRDGGTTIHKSKDKDITIIVCSTIEGNKNIYIGDYSMEYEQDMCK